MPIYHTPFLTSYNYEGTTLHVQVTDVSLVKRHCYVQGW